MMAVPNLTYTITRNKLSAVGGYNSAAVSFSADAAWLAFQARLTKAGEDYGLDKGTLIASGEPGYFIPSGSDGLITADGKRFGFQQVKAGVERSFNVSSDMLSGGDGEYRVSLYVQDMDGFWGDLFTFVPSGSTGLITADGGKFLSKG